MSQVVVMVDLLGTALDTVSRPHQAEVALVAEPAQGREGQAETEGPPSERLVQMVRQGLTEITQTDLLERLVERLGEL